MATTEQIRIAETTEAERRLIGFLTPEERRDALVQAARDKQHRNDEQLVHDHLERVLEGIRTRQIRPVGVDPEGAPYATNGKRFYSPDQSEPMTSVGRVPGYLDIHTLQKEDGSYAFIADEDLHLWPTGQQHRNGQQRLDHQQFQGELDRIRERKPWL